MQWNLSNPVTLNIGQPDYTGDWIIEAILKESCNFNWDLKVTGLQR